MAPFGASRAGLMSVVGDDIPDSGNLQAHYATRLLSGFSDGDTVDPFSDDAGANDAPAIGNPLYRTNILNSEPAVEYDADDHHDTGIDVDTDQPRSAYAVVRWPNDGNRSRAASVINSSGSSTRFTLGVEGDNSYVLNYGDTFASVNAATTDSYVIVSYRYGSGSGEVYENQTSKGTFSYTGNGDVGLSYFLGAANLDGSADRHLDDNLLELLDYQAEHSDTTRQNVEAYLNDIYGVF